jgi:hypothetical protein
MSLLFDARSSRDPTGTSKLRASFRAAAKLRLRQLRAAMRIALMDQDVLGLSQGTIMGFHPTDVRLNAFHAWLAYMAGRYLIGSWPDKYVDQAWESGRQVAQTEVAQQPATQASVDHLAQLAKQELEGIIAVLVQQVSRAAANVLTRQLKPAPAWRVLATAFDKVTLGRLLAMCNVLIISAFNQAKIETYRSAGLSHVGIIPETVQPSALVGVQTTGDDRVCDKCDGIAARSPYTLNAAADLIPAHPNCRCSVYAWHG